MVVIVNHLVACVLMRNQAIDDEFFNLPGACTVRARQESLRRKRGANVAIAAHSRGRGEAEAVHLVRQAETPFISDAPARTSPRPIRPDTGGMVSTLSGSRIAFPRRQRP